MSFIYLNITNVDFKRKDPVFWIDVDTNMVKYKQKRKRVPRYYSELEKLHNHLVLTLDDVLIPALPSCPSPRLDKEGQVVGKQWWFTIKLPNEVYTTAEDIGRVESQVQLWLDRITRHERAKYSEGLREFVESEVGFRPVLKMLKTSKQILVNLSEEDMEPEFGFWTKELTAFSNNLNVILSKMEKLTVEETEISQYWIDLSSAWVSYGGVERNPTLFMLFKSIAKGYQQLSDIERSQIFALNETLVNEVSYQSRNCLSAQNVMQRRLNALSDYLTSRKITESSLKAVERLKSSINIDSTQASDAIAILENARINERENYKRFNRVDKNLRNDIESNYKPNVEMDMFKAIKEYAKSQLYLERKKLLIFQEIYIGYHKEKSVA